ncbi:hypothetical protein [Parabacteroides distasonis]|uniref:hypothetical protein n=1 Tax=Parabacteroides distasonis TaxID=823 RepID=UPI001F3987DD|nr:hypothetical protein [Parabacteroides distasonis]MCE9060031.1 hypothetical protein [Parabacteroides distasonis]
MKQTVEESWIKCMNLIFKDAEKQYHTIKKDEEKDIEHILRNYVTPPIQGAITREEIQKRHLALVYSQDNFLFMGVEQDGILIDKHGNKVSVK